MRTTAQECGYESAAAVKEQLVQLQHQSQAQQQQLAELSAEMYDATNRMQMAAQAWQDAQSS